MDNKNKRQKQKLKKWISEEWVNALFAVSSMNVLINLHIEIFNFKDSITFKLKKYIKKLSIENSIVIHEQMCIATTIILRLRFN